MFPKALLSLLFLAGMLLLATCGIKQARPSPQAGMANPASVYCEQNGGKLDLRQDASGGVAGVCVFEDGSECDEWAFFRGECQPGNSPVTAEPAAAIAKDLRIAYFKDGHVMFWTGADGAQILADASAETLQLSDDGQVVAFLGTDASGTFGLYGAGTDGTAARLLVPGDSLQKMQPPAQIVAFDFAPASHMLYFTTDQYDLSRVDADNGNPATIFEANEGGFFSFSPNGQWMTLYHPNEVALAHPDGSASRIAFSFPPDFSYTMMGPEIAWKADSSGFNLVSATGPQGEKDSMSIWSIPVTGEPVRQMSYAGPYGATLSPDGGSVVYLYFQHDPVDVHMVTPDGKDIPCGAYSSKDYPGTNFMGWSPDSRSFLLSINSQTMLLDASLCAAGKSPAKLTDTKYGYPVVWVDAERFLFISEGNLRVQRRGGASAFVDAVSSADFDFSIVRP